VARFVSRSESHSRQVVRWQMAAAVQGIPSQCELAGMQTRVGYGGGYSICTADCYGLACEQLSDPGSFHNHFGLGQAMTSAGLHFPTWEQLSTWDPVSRLE
jgi:hypothetical protein